MPIQVCHRRILEEICRRLPAHIASTFYLLVISTHIPLALVVLFPEVLSEQEFLVLSAAVAFDAFRLLVVFVGDLMLTLRLIPDGVRRGNESLMLLLLVFRQRLVILI